MLWGVYNFFLRMVLAAPSLGVTSAEDGRVGWRLLRILKSSIVRVGLLGRHFKLCSAVPLPGRGGQGVCGVWGV